MGLILLSEEMGGGGHVEDSFNFIGVNSRNSELAEIRFWRIATCGDWNNLCPTSMS